MTCQNPLCAYSCAYFLHPAIKALDVLIFFVKGFICYVLNFSEKKSHHVLNWPCAYKKMSVCHLSRSVVRSNLAHRRFKFISWLIKFYLNEIAVFIKRKKNCKKNAVILFLRWQLSHRKKKRDFCLIWHTWTMFTLNDRGTMITPPQ